jgi:serine phosphatase RsbU (regulator of sigma subunit)
MAMKAINKKAKKTKKPWRQRFTLAGILLFSVLFSTLIAGSCAGYYAVRVVYENKLIDTWALLFLELERKSHHLSDKMTDFARAAEANPSPSATNATTIEPPQVVLRATDESSLETIRGSFPHELSASVWGLKKTILSDPVSILQYAGENFLALPALAPDVNRFLKTDAMPGNYFLLWKIDLMPWLGIDTTTIQKSTLYLVSKQGKLLYSNTPSITETSYIQSPLVQKFIATPVRQGQLEFDGKKGRSYGFFYEVPRTNIMMFVETSKQMALSTVREVALRFAYVLLGILGVVAILLKFPLSSLTEPLRELARICDQIGQGHFNIKPKSKGFGELNMLGQSFSKMASDLVAREERIQVLLEEQRKKIRLEGEIAIAQRIQDTFLPKAPLPKESGLDIASHYLPASECAGDWFNYFYDEKKKESVFAIADITGHGAGSAMFTAMVAAAFEETKLEKNDSFSLINFAKRVNHLLFVLGNGKWCTTLLIAKYLLGEETLEILNAGHPFPLFISPIDQKNSATPIEVRADFLGIAADASPALKKIQFPKGTSLLMFTDGLIEGRPDKLYSERRLSRACSVYSYETAEKLISKVLDDWSQFMGDESPADDLCLLAVKAE